MKKNYGFTLSDEKILFFDKYYNWWVRILKQGIMSLWAIFVVYVGPRGSGKSFSAIKDAISIDSRFNVDQICFTKDQVDQAIEKLAYTGGSVIVWDEFGAEMYARDWYEESQKLLVRKLQVIRQTEVTLFVVMPHIKFGDSSADFMANYGLEMSPPKHRDFQYRIGKALKMGGLYSKRQRMDFRPIWLNGRIFHVPFVNPLFQNQELFAAYFEKKKEYIDEQTEMGREKEKGKGLTGTQLRYLSAFVSRQTVSQIADDFDVSEQTVKDMKRKLRRKGALPKRNKKVGR